MELRDSVDDCDIKQVTVWIHSRPCCDHDRSRKRYQSRYHTRSSRDAIARQVHISGEAAKGRCYRWCRQRTDRPLEDLFILDNPQLSCCRSYFEDWQGGSPVDRST